MTPLPPDMPVPSYAYAAHWEAVEAMEEAVEEAVEEAMEAVAAIRQAATEAALAAATPGAAATADHDDRQLPVALPETEP